MPENLLDEATPSRPTIPSEQPTEGKNHIHVPVGNMDDLLLPGASAEDFLDAIIQAPEEKLIPWEECYLPSGGVYYGWPDGMVMVRAMGQTAEKVLATDRLQQSGQSIDMLFKECCKFPPGFDPVDLLLGDRIFLLYFLRGITHGNVYEFAITCPNTACQQLSTHQYDLNELAGTIQRGNSKLGTEPFDVDLPYMSEMAKRRVWVGVRFLRASDAHDMLAKRKARKKAFAHPGGVKTGSKNPFDRARATDPRRQNATNQELDETITENLEKIIVSVMGVADPFKVRSFIQRMHAQDTATVREWLRENTPGIDNTVTVECPDCNTTFTVELPISESFFRPTKQR
jgi:hypothetical protein